jgi:hypothetical protein
MQITTNQNFSGLFRFLLFVATLGFMCSCGTKKTTDKVSGEVVLKIGPVEITQYEFLKNKELFDGTGNANKKEAQKKWLTDFIDRAYFLADAYSKHYDTIAAINKIADNAALDHIARVDGYVWKRVEEPKLQISNKVLRDAYKKQSAVYYLDVLFFKNQNALDSVLNGRTVSNKSDFKQVAQRIKNNKTTKSFSNIYVWPFSAFTPVRDKIYTMNPGEVTAPFLTRKGYFMVHLNKKENVKQQPFRKAKEQIETELKSVKTEQIADKNQKNIFEKARIEIIEPEVSRLSEYLQNNKNELPLTLLGHSLMSYNINNQRKVYTVSQYWDYIHHLPLMLHDFSKKEAITATLKDEVIRQYLLRVADSLGILHENKYLLDKKNFRNELILLQYYQKEFRTEDSISEEEIRGYYEQHKAFYTGGKISVVSFLYFKDYASALNNRDMVNRIVSNGKFFEFRDSMVIKGLVSYQPNIKIERDNNELPYELTNEIFSIPEGEVSNPVEYNNKFALFFVTKREGIRVKGFDEVRNEMKAILENEKIEHLKNERIKELKDEYKIEVKKI